MDNSFNCSEREWEKNPSSVLHSATVCEWVDAWVSLASQFCWDSFHLLQRSKLSKLSSYLREQGSNLQRTIHSTYLELTRAVFREDDLHPIPTLKPSELAYKET